MEAGMFWYKEVYDLAIKRICGEPCTSGYCWVEAKTDQEAREELKKKSKELKKDNLGLRGNVKGPFICKKQMEVAFNQSQHWSSTLPSEQ
jgi:hypothetical protein